MKLALTNIANLALTTWAILTASVSTLTVPALPDWGRIHRFPTIVAHTAEGQIMDGPRGLRLITPCGPTPVDATPDGFLVYHPVPHILQPLVGRHHLSIKADRATLP